MKRRRLLEFIALFFLSPGLFHAILHKYSPVPFLIGLSLVTGWYLYRTPDHDNKTLWNLRGAREDLPRILLTFSVVGSLLVGFVLIDCPEYFLYCPKNHYTVWLSIMWSYPLLAVYPQELIFRAFFFHRYAALFNTPAMMIGASAVAFSFGHIIYYHPYSMMFTLGGGALFSYTYWRSRSLLAATLEHALYGCLLYTIGLGRFFFTGIDQLIP